VHQYPSEMAQNFWTAIFAWSVCFLVTIIVSLASGAPRTELAGLVYSQTPRLVVQNEVWYGRPAVLAVLALLAVVVLNILFR
jgi:solute:Na+ symporter, SSS family